MLGDGLGKMTLIAGVDDGDGGGGGGGSGGGEILVCASFDVVLTGVAVVGYLGAPASFSVFPLNPVVDRRLETGRVEVIEANPRSSVSTMGKCTGMRARCVVKPSSYYKPATKTNFIFVSWLLRKTSYKH